MRHIFAFAYAAVLLVVAQSAGAQPAQDAPPTREQVRAAMRSQLPEPPKGFDWKLYKNAVFLKPLEWHEREAATPRPPAFPVATYAASPQAFSESKAFETGLTINVYSGMQKRANIEAKKAAVLYLKPFLDTHKKEEVLILDQKTAGDYERTVFRYRDAPAGLTPIVVHKFILANNVTDAVHVFTFESPEASWAESWEKYGAPILSRLQVVAQLPSD